MKHNIWNWKTWTGIGILIGMALSYFIEFEVRTSATRIVRDSLLGLFILHNVFILGIYILIALSLIFVGVGKIKLI
jgi:hypothetical protein